MPSDWCTNCPLYRLTDHLGKGSIVAVLMGNCLRHGSVQYSQLISVRGGNGELSLGSRVQTLHSLEEGGDGRWYSGTVERLYDNGDVRIQYDDGDVWTGSGIHACLLSRPIPAASPSTGAQLAAPPPESAEAATGDMLACPVCLVNQMNVALGCGHRLCSACLPSILEKPSSACPVCRARITLTLPLYN